MENSEWRSLVAKQKADLGVFSELVACAKLARAGYAVSRALNGTQSGYDIVIADSKGGKTRTIDLHSEVRRALYDYIYKEDPMRRDARDPDSAYVFTSQRSAWLRRKGRPDHLTVRGLEYIWKGVKQGARQDEYEIIHDITFHDLRHDFAHRARAAGWGLEEIAVYLGHQTRDGLPAIATTARYTLPSRQQLIKCCKVMTNELIFHVRLKDRPLRNARKIKPRVLMVKGKNDNGTAIPTVTL